MQIDPALRLDPAYRSPALQKTFDQARTTVGGVRETVPGPAPGEDRGIKHTPVEESLAGQPILISARVAKGEDYPSAIALVEQGTVRLAPLVSDVMPLVELKAAIAMLGSESGQRMKVIMEHG